MKRATRLLLGFLLGAGATSVQPASRLLAAIRPAASGQHAQTATLQPASADIRFGDAALPAETQAAEQLLQLANQARRQAGVPPLAPDSGLSQAAHMHARVMLEAHQLSHRLEGEASLPQRLAVATSLQLDEDAENIAIDYDPEHGHDHLMLSPPHRANLLNPSYNVVGLGVVRSGERLYIVEDFGHALPRYSETEWKDHVAVAVNQIRMQAGQPELRRGDLLNADTVACSMAEADKVATPPVRKLAERFTVLTYTSLHPETLPSGASHAIASRTLRAFSIGACYARTDTYPTGVYWVVLSLE